MYFSSRFWRRVGAFVPFLLVIFGFAARLTAASTVTLAWDRNPETGIAGYKVYLGNSPRDYTSVVDAGNNTNQIVSNLVPGTTYYFAATAYSTNGMESDFSSELSHTVLNTNTANTAPLISAIADADMPANGSLTISFSVQDAETPADNLILNATSSNPDLMPESNIVLGGNGATRMVTLTPAVDQGGTATITIIVSDGSLSASESFALDVSVPPTALVAAYSFDAGSGTILQDLTGNTNTGVINGAVWAAAGRFGGALTFDGIDDLVTIADAATLDLTRGMTLEAWIYPTAQNAVWRSVMVKERQGGGVYNLYASSDTGVPVVSVVRRNGSFNDVRNTSPVPANTWTHLAATYDGTTLRLFVNSIEVSSEVLRGPLLASTGPLRIGGNFQGMIDEVRIYDQALSPAEIEADMLTPLGSPRSFIGNAADGSLTDAIGASWINAGRYQATNDLTVSAMLAKVAPISGRYKCAIYSDSGGQPSRLLESSAEISSPTGGWQFFPLSSSLVLTNGQHYWLAIWSDDAGSKVYYSGTDGTLRWGNYAYGTWPDPFTTSAGATANYCIYAVGTPFDAATLLSIVVTPEDPTIVSGTMLQLRAIGIYSDDSTQDITSQVSWSSDAPEVVGTIAPGMATGLSAGYAIISGTLNGKSGATMVAVQLPLIGNPDGGTLTDEIIATVAPLAADVPFAIDVFPVGDSHLTQLTWESIPGAIYHVLGKSDPLAPNWLDISADILAEGSLTSWVDPDTTALTSIYRVLRVE